MKMEGTAEATNSFTLSATEDRLIEGVYKKNSGGIGEGDGHKGQGNRKNPREGKEGRCWYKRASI